MKTAFRFILASVLVIGTASLGKAQSPAVTHNTWASGTPLPDQLRHRTIADPALERHGGPGR